MGLCNLGFIVDLISEPVIAGFTTGSAILIASTQLNSVFAVSKCKDGEFCDKGLEVIDYVLNIFEKISDNCKNIPGWAAEKLLPTALYSFICMGVILVFSRVISKRLPKHLKIVGSAGPLLVVLLSVLINANSSWMANVHQIRDTGPICSQAVNSTFPHWACLPSPTFPHHLMQLRVYKELFGPAVTVALIGYMEAISIAKTVSRQHNNVKIQPGAELVALGLCNLFCSFMQGYPVTGSFSRTAVNSSSGARSPVAGFVTALTAGLALLFLTSLLGFLPKAALGAIVFVAIVKLIGVKEALHLWRVSKRDFCAFFVVFLLVLLVNVQVALVTGILLSWTVTLLSSKPVEAVIIGTRVSDSDPTGKLSLNETGQQQRTASCDLGVIDLLREAPAASLPLIQAGAAPGSLSSHHIVVLTLRSDLNFSTSQALQRSVALLIEALLPVSLVLNCLNVNDIDSTGLDILKDISFQLRNRSVPLFLTCASKHVRSVLCKAVKHDKALQQAWNVDGNRQGGSNYLSNLEREEVSLVLFDTVETALQKCKDSVLSDMPGPAEGVLDISDGSLVSSGIVENEEGILSPQFCSLSSIYRAIDADYTVKIKLMKGPKSWLKIWAKR